VEPQALLDGTETLGKKLNGVLSSPNATNSWRVLHQEYKWYCRGEGFRARHTCKLFWRWSLPILNPHIMMCRFTHWPLLVCHNLCSSSHHSPRQKPRIPLNNTLSQRSLPKHCLHLPGVQAHSRILVAAELMDIYVLKHHIPSIIRCWKMYLSAICCFWPLCLTCV
jgi:hypothetical protein